MPPIRRRIDEIGRIAPARGAHVLVDEVYRDVAAVGGQPAAARHDVFITTSSLTKSYGLSGLRAGWVIASDDVTYRVRRAQDIVEGSGSIVAERLATLAFDHLDASAPRARQRLLARNAASVTAFLASRPELEWVDVGRNGRVPAHSRRRRMRRRSPTACCASETPPSVPGSFFEAPAHFRLGFGGETSRLERGLEQLAASAGRMRPKALKNAA